MSSDLDPVWEISKKIDDGKLLILMMKFSISLMKFFEILEKSSSTINSEEEIKELSSGENSQENKFNRFNCKIQHQIFQNFAKTQYTNNHFEDNEVILAPETQSYLETQVTMEGGGSTAVATDSITPIKNLLKDIDDMCLDFMFTIRKSSRQLVPENIKSESEGVLDNLSKFIEKFKKIEIELKSTIDNSKGLLEYPETQYDDDRLSEEIETVETDKISELKSTKSPSPIQISRKCSSMDLFSEEDLQEPEDPDPDYYIMCSKEYQRAKTVLEDDTLVTENQENETNSVSESEEEEDEDYNCAFNSGVEDDDYSNLFRDDGMLAELRKECESSDDDFPEDNRKSDIDNDMIPGDNRQSDSDNDMIPVIRKVTKKTGTLHDFFKTKDREEDFNGRCHQNRKEEKENSIEGTNNYSHQSEKLKNHQLEAVNFLYSNCYGNTAESTKESGHGSVLAHCMGLGKSFTGNAKKKTKLNHI